MKFNLSFTHVKQIVILSFFAVIITFFGCGGGEESSTEENTMATTEVLKGTMNMDLGDYGFPVSINIPDASFGSQQIEEQSWGAVEIKVGNGFYISIKEGEGELIDMTFQKSMVENADFPQFKQYLVDQENEIMYEAGFPDMPSEYHFYMVKKIGEVDYVMEDIKSEKYSKEAIEKMYNCAKSLTALENDQAL